MDYLHTDLIGDKKSVTAVSVVDKGSIPQCANMSLGCNVGRVEEAVAVSDDNLCEQVSKESLQQVCTVSCDTNQQESGIEWSRKKLCEPYVDSVDLPELCKCQFFHFLSDHHEAFCLEENEREETDALQMEIDAGDAVPRKQTPRHIPFAVKQEF